MFQNIYKNKKVLIIGHTGFKGSWLTIWLMNLGAKISGYSLPYKLNSGHLDKKILNKISHYEGDVRNYDKLLRLIKKIKPEIIFHLAAQALVKKSYKEPINTFETNMVGTVNVLNSIRNVNSIKAAVIITSDKVYKNVNKKEGYKENDILEGSDPYSASKSCAEIISKSYINSFFKNNQKFVCIARAGNVIGGGDWSEDRIVPDVVKSVIKKKKLIIRSPNATRPWQHVLEPLSAYLLIGKELLKRNKKINGHSFNVGPNFRKFYTVKNILDRFKLDFKKLSWKTIKNNELKEANLLHLNSKKIKRFLKWKSTLSYEQTVQFTSKWYLNFLKNKKNSLNYSFKQIDLYKSIALKNKNHFFF